MKNTILLRVDVEDVKKLMGAGIRLFLEAHPDMEAMHLTRRKMFHEAVKHYVEE